MKGKGKKKKSLLIIALLLLVGATFGYVSSTYAKYASDLPVTDGQAVVAKWNFDRENLHKDITVNLTTTASAETLTEGKIAPGTEGSFGIELTNEDTEVGVKYRVTLKDIDNTQLPAHLKFYSDAAHTQEIQPGSDDAIEGTIAAKDATGDTVTIYWAWEYGTEDYYADEDEAQREIDDDDTEAGHNAATLDIGINVSAYQVRPGTSI